MQQERRMKPKVKQLWLEALKSGKYKQGTGALKNDDGSFCCLGVLCDIYAKTQKKKGFQKRVLDGYIFGNIEESAVLPKEVIKWAGMPSFDGISNTHGQYALPGLYLTIDNDKGKTFEEIANIIDLNL